MTEIRSVGLFLLLPAPLNPIGAFDAEAFKTNFRALLAENPQAKFIAVNLSGLDFVYSDAYNAFVQFHQELSKRKGAFAVLADKESLAKSLKKVGLERFIRIFMDEASMYSYKPVDKKTSDAPASIKPMMILSQPKPQPVSKPVPQPEVKPETTLGTKPEPAPVQKPEPEAAPQPQPIEPRILDKNPLVDEASSSKGSLVAVFVLLLIVAAVVSYLVL
jgi:anti-anti-sigma factor